MLIEGQKSRKVWVGVFQHFEASKTPWFQVSDKIQSNPEFEDTKTGKDSAKYFVSNYLPIFFVCFFGLGSVDGSALSWELHNISSYFKFFLTKFELYLFPLNRFPTLGIKDYPEIKRLSLLIATMVQSKNPTNRIFKNRYNKIPTDPFTNLELWNPSIDVSKLCRIFVKPRIFRLKNCEGVVRANLLVHSKAFY